MSRLSKDERKRLRREADRRLQDERSECQSDPLQRRERLYQQYFGKYDDVAHDVSMIPHIDVYIYRPRRPEREFFTFITSGLSDFQANGGFGRSELVFYSTECKDGYISLLRNLAHEIIKNDIEAGHGHTLTNGTLLEPLFENTRLSCVLLHESGIEPECDMHEEWEINDEPVYLLNVMPISESECEFIQDNDVAEFSDILEKHPDFDDDLFHGPRKSFV